MKCLQNSRFLIQRLIIDAIYHNSKQVRSFERNNNMYTSKYPRGICIREPLRYKQLITSPISIELIKLSFLLFLNFLDLTENRKRMKISIVELFGIVF